MKAIILAAGKGTRMLPLTKTVPKPLIAVNGKPFLYYLIKNLNAAGFDQIGIIAGYLIEKMHEFVDEYCPTAVIIEQKEQLGSAHAIKLAKEFVGSDHFIVVNGDGLFSVPDLKSLNRKDHYSYIIGKKVCDPSKYGVLKVEKITTSQNLLEIIEKPKEFVGDLVNIGLYKFDSSIWNALELVKPSLNGEYQIVDAINLLAKENKFKVLDLQDYWIDFGSLEDVPIAEEFVKNNF